MLDNYNESVEASFNDKDVSLNTSSDKSSEMDHSSNSAGPGSSDGNQFGSPAAVGAPQLTSTLVFSATKLVPDLTGTSVLAAKSPKLKTPPKSSTKTLKGLLKTPQSVNKRRSVCFVDHRNETAYLNSNPHDSEWIPGVTRVKTPQPKFDAKSPEKDEEMEEEEMDVEEMDVEEMDVEETAGAKGKKGKATPSPNKRVEGGKRAQRGSQSPGQNPRGGKRRRVEPTTYAGVTISRTLGKDGSEASYVELADDAPGIEDIEAYFMDAANRMFSDLMEGTTQTPDKYFAAGRWASHPTGNFPKVASGKKRTSASDDMEQDGAWVDEVTKCLTGTATPSKNDKDVVKSHVAEAAGFLFKSPKPSADQVHVISACLANAAAALNDSAQKLPGSRVAKGAKQMFTKSSLPKQPWQDMMQSMHASFTPTGKGKGKSQADTGSPMYANQMWQATAPPTGSKKPARRSSTGSIKGNTADAKMELEVEAPKSRRSSTSSIKTKTPAKAVEEDDFDASSAFAETAPKTGEKKASRRSSSGAPIEVHVEAPSRGAPRLPLSRPRPPPRPWRRTTSMPLLPLPRWRPRLARRRPTGARLLPPQWRLK